VAGRSHSIETNFREECETDLFGETGVFVSWASSELIPLGFENLAKRPTSPKWRYFDMCTNQADR